MDSHYLHSSGHRLHGLRLSDFTAAAWFKPPHLGGLDQQKNSRWIRSNTIVWLDGSTFVGAICSSVDEWITPGQASNCAIADHSWSDDFRSATEIGTPLELLLRVESKTHGPLRCIALGRIVEKHDPHGRW